MKKNVKILPWALAVILIIFVLSFVTKKQKNTICKAIDIQFADSSKIQYIDREDVLGLINSRDDSIIGKAINSINIAQLEDKLNKYPYVKHAEVYKKINGRLTIELERRVPVLRVINSENKSFYLSYEGVVMPISPKVQVRLPIASGKIGYNPELDTIIDIYEHKYDTLSNVKTIRDLHQLANFINKSEFWLAQTQQIYVNEKKEFELIPLVGRHVILLGGIERYEEKFRNLEATYRKGFPSKGWNQYETLNLKYKNQVICSKAE